jgi:uncharacterized repeat protein (TIGR03803 family)
MRAKVTTTLLLLIFVISIASASTQKVIYTFTGGSDGGQPYSGVISDQSGNLYGVTQTGGAHDNGTVFELSPSKNGWIETVLYSFTGGADGSTPIGGLATDGRGDLFGTASSGGTEGCGTLFELPVAGVLGQFTVLHTFSGNVDRRNDGCQPLGKLFWVPGDPGALWGTTNNAGSNYGTVFTFDLDGDTYGSGSFSGRNGQTILGGLNDWACGTTYWGGGSGEGEVYCVTFPSHFKIIHSFNTKDKAGYYPMGELFTATVNGVPTMYGTTTSGGAGGKGTVYALSQPGKTWKRTALYSFSGPDGANPTEGPVQDAAGNLYGTTQSGGTSQGYAGTVFKLTPSVGPKNKVIWTLTTLYNFTGGADGGGVTSGVILDSAGNLYGTTVSGGAYTQGVVYEIIP